MLYLGIDQHARQITISLRDESGDVLEARQVSTQPGRINAFFEQLTRGRLREGELFVAVLEVCGFNDLADPYAEGLPMSQGNPDSAVRQKEAQDGPARCCSAQRAVVGQPGQAPGRQAGSRSATGRRRFHV